MTPRTAWLGLLLVVSLLVSACQDIDPASSPHTPPPTADLVYQRIAYQPTATPAQLPLATSVPSPTNPPAAPRLKPSPTPSPTPNPMLAYSILNMRQGTYPGGDINRRGILLDTEDFIRYYIDYPSDGLTITGVLQVPKQGAAPYPVVILNHGYWARRVYQAGTGTWDVANFLSSNGYITIAPDYRSWGAADVGPSFFHSGLVTDVLNLISSVDSLPEADPTRIGMWGHSMGGGIATKVLTIDSRVKAAVLYNPNSSRDGDLIEEWGPGCWLNTPRQRGLRCNRGEVLPPTLPTDLYNAYIEAANSPDILRQIAPHDYLRFVTAPVQIHSGSADRSTPPEWHLTIYEGLQTAEKPVEFFLYEGEGHLFEDEQWDLHLARILAFYNTHLVLPQNAVD